MNSLSVIGKIKAFIVFLLLVSSSAYALGSENDFEVVGIGGNIMSIVDKSSIRINIDNDRLVNVFLFAEGDSHVPGIRMRKGEVLQLKYKINCSNLSSGFYFMEQFDSNGKSIYKQSVELQMRSEDSFGSTGEKILNLICTKKL